MQSSSSSSPQMQRRCRRRPRNSTSTSMACAVVLVLGCSSALVDRAAAFQPPILSPPAPVSSSSSWHRHRHLQQQQQHHLHAPRVAPAVPSRHRPGVGPLAAQPQSSGGGIEGLFRLIRSDALSLTVGSLCLLALVANRLFTEDLYDSQSRTDIIGVISAGGLLLNGLTLQDVAVREAEAVELQGDKVDEADAGVLSPRQASVLRWAADTYMQAFPNTASVLVWHKGRTLLRKGIVPPAAATTTKGTVEVLPIVQKALTMAPEADGLSQPTYIPDLQVLPGRVEFVNYLPQLCQGVVLQPFDDNRGLVILGLNRKRVFTPKDLTQARVVAQKVQSCLLAGASAAP